MKPGPKLGSKQKKRRSAAVRHSIAPDSTPVTHRLDDASLMLSDGFDGPRQQGSEPPRLSPSTGLVTRRRLQFRESTPHFAVDQGSGVTAPAFSQIMYPSHESRTRPQTPNSVRVSTSPAPSASGVTIDAICKGLGISKQVYTRLMELYFQTMTSFTLFKPNHINTKLTSAECIKEAEALAAAMFSFSARFYTASRDTNNDGCRYPSPAYFADAAEDRLHRILNHYEQGLPPLHVLQAVTLHTFFHITKGVQAKSWRLLGNAIRLAYDMKLHLVDVDSGGEKQPVSPALWSALEERRRIWWALWEMDVFASTIRRLPLAVDRSQNYTHLPVPDDMWLRDSFQPSCHLNPDANLRWKQLCNTGNTSPKAWFIVINSLMHSAQHLVFNPLLAGDASLESKADNLTAIANAIYCASMSLPQELFYDGQHLDFQTTASKDDINCRQYHCDIYSIHLMTQLGRFIVNHHEVCTQMPSSDALQPGATSSWSNYIKTTASIVTMVRDSNHEHIKYVNPCLSNTLWFAASAQIACKVFGPPALATTLASSNFDLLALTIDRFISFWDSTDILRRRLSRIEAALQKLKSKESQVRPNGIATGVNMLSAHQNLDATTNHLESRETVDPTATSAEPSLFMDMMGGSEQVMFDDLQHFLPYGVDEVWGLGA